MPKNGLTAGAWGRNAGGRARMREAELECGKRPGPECKRPRPKAQPLSYPITLSVRPSLQTRRALIALLIFSNKEQLLQQLSGFLPVER